jgi:TRAP-type C4-dicarboxylate transport system permease small subunit
LKITQRRLAAHLPKKGSKKMNTLKIVAICLIIAGGLGLAYGSFTYTKESHNANIGPLQLTVKDKETVNIPMWAGISAIVLGGGLLLANFKRA